MCCSSLTKVGHVRMIQSLRAPVFLSWLLQVFILTSFTSCRPAFVYRYDLTSEWNYSHWSRGETQDSLAKTDIMPVEGASPFSIRSLPTRLCVLQSIITLSSLQTAPFWGLALNSTGNTFHISVCTTGKKSLVLHLYTSW